MSREMTKAVVKMGMVILVSIAGASSFIVASLQLRQYQFVRGYYGKFCFEISHYPKSITRPVFYKTFEQCSKSLIEKR